LCGNRLHYFLGAGAGKRQAQREKCSNGNDLAANAHAIILSQDDKRRNRR